MALDRGYGLLLFEFRGYVGVPVLILYSHAQLILLQHSEPLHLGGDALEGGRHAQYLFSEYVYLSPPNMLGPGLAI